MLKIDLTQEKYLWKYLYGVVKIIVLLLVSKNLTAAQLNLFLAVILENSQVFN